MTFEDLIPAPTGRFDGISRPYTPEDVAKLRGSEVQRIIEELRTHSAGSAVTL